MTYIITALIVIIIFQALLLRAYKSKFSRKPGDNRGKATIRAVKGKRLHIIIGGLQYTVVENEDIKELQALVQEKQQELNKLNRLIEMSL